MRLSTIAKVTVEGLHHWSGAMSKVSFLAHPHRHLFVIEAEARVEDPDREVEFILLGREIKEWISSAYGLADGAIDFGNRSCEMIASAVLKRFGLDRCTVWEDGENGGRAERE